MARSSIEWTEETWNPVTGCSQVSPGCDNCYAERLAHRLQAMGNPRYENAFELTLQLDKVTDPLSWKKPRVVFVNSMSDLFHPDVPDDFIWSVFDVMEQADIHTFQVLTKRPQRACDLFDGYTLPNNVWIGTSIELDSYTFRANYLRKIDAKIRFLSCEPLLGPLPSLDLTDLSWIIVGGESGPGHRPMDAEWVRDIRDRTRAEGVPFFFKQWGGRTPKAGGRDLDGRTWEGMPELHR
ncbi:MAG: phage Gp37/Gp68 family protein [Acidimicrobiia bacterium]|nr:phage Gp37/Gp68 family protein [Acidimicrobiia bacterium]